MKKISTLIYLLLILSSNYGSCKSPALQNPPNPSLSKDSLFVLNTSWTDQNNKKVTLQSFSESKFILAMVYTGCGRSCPLTVSKIQELIRKSEKKNVKVVLASFDYIKDTPEHLKQYMKSRSIDEKNWTMITADSDEKVRELANILGISYKKDIDGEYTHSNVITLVDSNGVILKSLEGLNANADEFIQILKK